jgi:hypothetical protein
VVLQPTADGQHLLLAGSPRTSRPVGSRREIAPIDTIQSLALGTQKPTLHGTQRNAEANRYGTLGGSAPHRSHDLLSSLGVALFDPSQATPGFLRWYRSNAIPPQAHPLARCRAWPGGGTPVGLRPPSVPPPGQARFYSTNDLNVLTPK